MRLDGRVAAVTGAASGIGRALAEVLAARGCELSLADVNEAGLAETAARVGGSGRRVTIHRVDVADPAAVDAWAAATVAAHGRVHLLVNNAGVSVTAPFEQQSLDDWHWIVGVNFWGVVHGCRAFLPHLRAAGEGHVVNLSSVLGIIGLPTQSSYCATKFAVRGLSEALWAELADSGIGVTVVHPGAVRTDIVRASRSADPAARERVMAQFERRALPPERAAEQIVRAVERGRMRVLVCRETRVVDWAKRLFPAAVHRAVLRGYRRFGSLG